MSVKFNGQHITNSPFTVHVNAATVVDAEMNNGTSPAPAAAAARLINTHGYQVYYSTLPHIPTCLLTD